MLYLISHCNYQQKHLYLRAIYVSELDMIFADPPYFLSNGGHKLSGG